MCLQYKSFENTVEKEKLLVTSNFSLFHSVFYLFGELSAIFIKFKIVVCKLFQFEASEICYLGKGKKDFGKMLVTSIFSFPHKVFYPLKGKLDHLSHI